MHYYFPAWLIYPYRHWAFTYMGLYLVGDMLTWVYLLKEKRKVVICQIRCSKRWEWLNAVMMTYINESSCYFLGNQSYIMSWVFFNADSWLLHCCYLFCSDATSTCMGSWSAHAFNAGGCWVQFENSMAIFASRLRTHFVFLVHFLAKVSTTSTIGKLRLRINDLLCFCKWICDSSGIGFTIGVLWGCNHTCFHQVKVGMLILSVLHTMWIWMTCLPMFQLS